jgi:tetratricopeptide (TPR) repeat protein
MPNRDFLATEPAVLEELRTTRVARRRVEIWLTACREIQYERPLQALSYANEARLEARKAKLIDQEIHALRMAGICHYAAHQYEQALAIFTSALRRLKARGDSVGIMKSYQNIALTMRRLGRHAEALDMYARALVLARSLDDRPLLMNILTNVGATYSVMQRPVEALDAYGEALSISERLGDESFQAYIAGNIADVYVTIGADTSAIEWARRSLEAHRTRQDLYGMAMTLNNLGRVHRNMGEFKTAQTYFTECLAVMTSISDTSGRARTHLFLAELALQRGALQDAIESAEQSKTLFRELNDREFEADALIVLGQVYERSSDVERALSYFRQARTLLEATQNNAKRADIMVREARVLLELQRVARAHTVLQHAKSIAEASGSADALAEVHRMLAEIFTTKGNLQKTLQHRERLFELKLQLAEQLHANHARSMELRLQVEQAERKRLLAEQQSSRLEATLEARTIELTESAVALGQTMDLLTSLERDIRTAMKSKSQADTVLKEALIRISAHLRTGRDRRVFDERLNAANRPFLRALEDRAPRLSQTELKVAMLLRLNLQSKEIATIMNVDTKTIEVYRTRLRAKLRLQTTDNLVRFLQSLATV